MSLSGKRCLVLSSSWFPIGIESLQDSLTKLSNQGSGKGLITPRTFIIDCVMQDGRPYFERYTLDQWIKKPHYLSYTLDECVKMGREVDVTLVRTKNFVFQTPEVIMKTCDRPFIQKLPMRASNVFARDGHKCWYCQSEGNLTLDHIQPQSRGGKSTWKNLITCCLSCNNEKGDMDVGKFCKIKGCEIPRPINAGSYPWLRQLGKDFPPSWMRHLEGLQISV